MTIYLLGATGFTGGLLLPQLLSRGLAPVAVGRNAKSLAALKQVFPAIDVAIANTLAQGFSIVQQKLFGIPGFLTAMQGLVKHVSFPRRKTSSVMSSVNSDVYLYAEAVDAQGRVLVSGKLEGHNMYQYTVDIMAWMALQVSEGNVTQYGVIGPARAFGMDELEAGHIDIGMRLDLKSFTH